jgi:membrane-associated phospholipid phosphatase
LETFITTIKKSFFLFFVLLFSIPTLLHAESFKDVKEDFISPVTTDARYYFYGGAILTGAIVIFEDAIVDPTQKEIANDKPLGSLSKFGDLAGQVIPNAIYAVGMGIASFGNNPLAGQRALGMFKATFYSSLVTTVLKYTIREPRPGKRDERNSFPSGHSTTAFAFSGYIVQEHGLAYGIPALLLSGFVGASRINDNRHYLHDVIAGMTIGLSYGIGISLRQKKIRDQKTYVTLLPFYQHDSKGIMASWTF